MNNPEVDDFIINPVTSIMVKSPDEQFAIVPRLIWSAEHFRYGLAVVWAAICRHPIDFHEESPASDGALIRPVG